VVCQFLCEEATETLTEKLFIPAVRKFIIKRLLAGSLRYTEVLSSDLQKNSLAALLRLGAVQKIKGADQETLTVDTVMVNSLEDTLGGKLPTQKAVAARL
ncbi:dihydroxyacetone phosphate acyltransferase-like, partial [Pseudochaenichthys georgianus]|uniref:dihydroxyacetone phosphate acyltransferase-like n=1 Tax=Pseudochaenichthys georgianus TaxID=52239 RepID=UPI00146C29D3